MLIDPASKQLIESLYLLAENDVDEITQMLDDLYWKVLTMLRQKKLASQLSHARKDFSEKGNQIPP